MGITFSYENSEGKRKTKITTNITQDKETKQTTFLISITQKDEILLKNKNKYNVDVLINNINGTVDESYTFHVKSNTVLKINIPKIEEAFEEEESDENDKKNETKVMELPDEFYFTELNNSEFILDSKVVFKNDEKTEYEGIFLNIDIQNILGGDKIIYFLNFEKSEGCITS
jgi:hypothetical protein